MRLTPKQAEAVAELIEAHPGEGASILRGHRDRDIVVTIGSTKRTVGGRGKITTA